MIATGKRTGFELVLFTSLALVCHACTHDEEPEPAAAEQVEEASADNPDDAAEPEGAPDAGSAAAEPPAAEPDPAAGPVHEYRLLEELPKPKASMPVPEIKVVELGPRPQPVPGVILDAFVDENDRPRYFVTKKALFFMRPDGKVRKRIARKSDPGHLEGPPMGFSDDGSWAWQAYVDEDHTDAQHPYEWIKTDIYDPHGRLWWTIQGHLEHISPDGKRAAAMLPEGSGMVLYKKGDSRESTREDGKRFIEPGTAMGDACPSNDGAIYISSMGGSEISLLDDNHENKHVIARIAAQCYLNACLPSVDRVLIDCSSPANGVANLFMYDSEGEELERYWFTTYGNRLFSFDKKNGRLLIGRDTGVFLIIDIKTGALLAVTERIEGMPMPIPMNKYPGTRDDFLDYAYEITKKEKDTAFVEDVKLFGSIVVQLRRKTQAYPVDTNIKLVVTDTRNNVIKAQNLGNTISFGNETALLPATWIYKNRINIHIGKKTRLLRIVEERKQ